MTQDVLGRNKPNRADPASMVSLEPFGARRIWSTGSTGLVAGLTAGTVEVVLAIV